MQMSKTDRAMEFEVCIESLEAALLADKYGADRVELCSALHEGGLTPTTGLVRQVVENSNQVVFAMIRPEAGGFVYSKSAIELMKLDIAEMAMAGAKGVVFGVLTSENEIDMNTNRELVEISKEHDLKTVFHRAFDFTADPEKSLNILIELGFDRLLTSGCQPKAIQGVDRIKTLHQQAGGKIEIMAGSGVTAENVEHFIDTNIDAIHFTAGYFEQTVQLGMGARLICDENKVSSIMKFKK